MDGVMYVSTHSIHDPDHQTGIYARPYLLGPGDAVAEADGEEQGPGEGLLEELAHLNGWFGGVYTQGF